MAIFGILKMLMCTLFWWGGGMWSQKVYGLYTHENVDIYRWPLTYCDKLATLLKFLSVINIGHHTSDVIYWSVFSSGVVTWCPPLYTTSSLYDAIRDWKMFLKIIFSVSNPTVYSKNTVEHLNKYIYETDYIHTI